jgi:hypothetical protein
MWNWFNCYLSGRHEFGVWCEPGAIFLRCLHCGRRSSGWALEARPISSQSPPPSPITRTKAKAANENADSATSSTTHVIPFNRSAAG